MKVVKNVLPPASKETTNIMLKRTNILKSHPKSAAAFAMAMLIVPLLVFGATNLTSNASELDAETAKAEYVDFSTVSDNETVTAVVPELTETIKYTIQGPGTIEPVKDCIVNSETGHIEFENGKEKANVKLVAPLDGTAEAKLGETVLPQTDSTVTIEDEAVGKTLTVTFTAPEPAPTSVPEPEAVPAPVQEQSYDNGYYGGETWTSSSTTYYTTSGGDTTSSTTPPDAPSSVPTTPHSMNSEQMSVAQEIFAAYNDYRASQGYSRVSWSDACANMAYASASGCAARGQLVHRLGIPADYQFSYSDILQNATWKMSGAEAVNTWRGSNGHRRMMQCDSASVAGVGVTQAGGYWYYVIVYDFGMTNQSGN